MGNKKVDFAVIIMALALVSCGKKADSDNFFKIKFLADPIGIGSGGVDIELHVCPDPEVPALVPYENFDDWELQVVFTKNPDWPKKNNPIADDSYSAYVSSQYHPKSDDLGQISDPVPQQSSGYGLDPAWEADYSEGPGCQKVLFDDFFKNTEHWHDPEIAPFDEVKFIVWRKVSEDKFDANGNNNEYLIVDGSYTWQIDMDKSTENSMTGEVIQEPSSPDEAQSQSASANVIPDDFSMVITEYFEDYEDGIPSTQCEVTTTYRAVNSDAGILGIESITEITNQILGDCSWTAFAPESFFVNAATGEAVDGGESRFFGNKSAPLNTKESSLFSYPTWEMHTIESIPSQDYLYKYDHIVAIDQYTGIRLFRQRFGNRSFQGKLDEGYCQWGQTLELHTNASIAGKGDGVDVVFDREASYCQAMAEALQPPSADPCDTVRAFFDAKNNENLEGYFAQYYTGGFSEALYTDLRDYQVWYFNEHDWEFTLNSCMVDWVSAIPPFSAKVTENYRAYTIYNGYTNDTTLNEVVYLTYENGKWKIAMPYSWEDVNPQELTFENRTDHPVSVYWTDYDKNERFWFDMAPGEVRQNISSAQTHFWTFYDKDTSQPLMYFWVPASPNKLILWQP